MPNLATREPFPSAADRIVPPADRDLQVLWRWLSVAVLAGTCGLVLWTLQPSLLLRNTTPNGGDLGAHVWFPAYLRDHLLPHWRVAGWSNDWFGGFPAGQFYFPIPALITVFLDAFFPYNVALKLTTAIGPVLMPAGAYAFGRGLRLRRPGPEFFAIATVCFLFFKGIATSAAAGTPESAIQFNQRIMGGTLVSALAGEYSFSIALTLALFALGAIAFSVRTGRRRWLAAVLVAATVLSHVVVGMFLGAGAVIIVGLALTRRHLRPLRMLRWASAMGAVGALLTAFWSLPLVTSFAYTSNMRYEKLTAYAGYLLVGEFTWLYVLAIVGVVFMVVRLDRAACAVLLLTITFAVVFVVWPELGAWNLRFLPFAYLGLFLMAAIGASETVRVAAGEFARLWTGPAPLASEAYADALPRAARTYRRVLSGTLAVGVVGVLVAGLWFNSAHKGFIPFWVEWNQTGYENQAVANDTQWKSNAQKQYADYHALIDRLAKLPAGRLLWEGGPLLDAYGTPLSLMLLPYWTDGRIQSFEGLYYESAASTPYVFMAVAPLSGAGNSSNPVRGLEYRDIQSFDVGVDMLRALGGRYYLAHSDAAKTAADQAAGLRLIDTVPMPTHNPAGPEDWNIYEVRNHALVAPLPVEPVVVTPKAGSQAECFNLPAGSDSGPQLGDWECVAAGWWNDHRLQFPLAEGGPARWRRSTAAQARHVTPRPLPRNRVSRVRVSDDRISFDVSRPGVPVVVRTSYYPAWVAHGARGPWRLTPNLMVVVPTGTHVDLRFERTATEKIGGLLSLGGLAGLGALVVVDVRTRRRRNAHNSHENPTELSGGSPIRPPDAAASTPDARAGDATMVVPP